MKQFKSQALFHHKDPNIFFRSEWQKGERPGVVYLVYRWFMALYVLASFVFAIYHWDSKDVCEDRACRIKWVVYMTHWGYTGLTFQIILAAICLTNWKMANTTQKQPFPLRCLYKLYWIVFVITSDAAFSITVLFWAFVYNPVEFPLNLCNLCMHAFNSCMVFIDLMVVAHPVYWVQGYVALCLVFAFSIFSGVYYLLGGTSHDHLPYIYAILDWRKPVITIAWVCGAAILVIAMHLVVCGIQILRTMVGNKLRARRRPKN